MQLPTEVWIFLDNVKAYFRRAKAHIAAWNPKEAKEDLEKVMELDHSLEGLAKKELARLEEMQKNKDLQDKEKLKKLFVWKQHTLVLEVQYYICKNVYIIE